MPALDTLLSRTRSTLRAYRLRGPRHSLPGSLLSRTRSSSRRLGALALLLLQAQAHQPRDSPEYARYAAFARAAADLDAQLRRTRPKERAIKRCSEALEDVQFDLAPLRQMAASPPPPELPVLVARAAVATTAPTAPRPENVPPPQPAPLVHTPGPEEGKQLLADLSKFIRIWCAAESAWVGSVLRHTAVLAEDSAANQQPLQRIGESLVGLGFVAAAWKNISDGEPMPRVLHPVSFPTALAAADPAPSKAAPPTPQPSAAGEIFRFARSTYNPLRLWLGPSLTPTQKTRAKRMSVHVAQFYIKQLRAAANELKLPSSVEPAARVLAVLLEEMPYVAAEALGAVLTEDGTLTFYEHSPISWLGQKEPPSPEAMRRRLAELRAEMQQIEAAIKRRSYPHADPKTVFGDAEGGERATEEPVDPPKMQKAEIRAAYLRTLDALSKFWRPLTQLGPLYIREQTYQFLNRSWRYILFLFTIPTGVYLYLQADYQGGRHGWPAARNTALKSIEERFTPPGKA